MDQFNYLAVLISIILGLGITQLLSGAGRLLQSRRFMQLYAPTLGWMGVLLVLHVQTWWVMFGLRTLANWTFVAFLLVLLQPTLLYLLASLVLPDVMTEAAPELRQHYFEQSRWFFGLAVALLVVSVVRDRVLTGQFPTGLNLAVHGLLLVGWGGAAITRNGFFHRCLVVYTALIMATYIAMLFGRLQ